MEAHNRLKRVRLTNLQGSTCGIADSSKSLTSSRAGRQVRIVMISRERAVH